MAVFDTVVVVVLLMMVISVDFEDVIVVDFGLGERYVVFDEKTGRYGRNTLVAACLLILLCVVVVVDLLRVVFL